MCPLKENTWCHLSWCSDCCMNVLYTIARESLFGCYILTLDSPSISMALAIAATHYYSQGLLPSRLLSSMQGLLYFMEKKQP